MNCPNCGTEIPANERYCRNCGYDALAPAQTMPSPTEAYSPSSFTGAPGVDSNAKTEILPAASQPTSETRVPFNTASQTQQRRSPLFVPLATAGAILLLIAVGALAYLYWPKRDSGGAGGKALPDHFGIFIQTDAQLSELRRRDFSNAAEGRDSLAGDAALPESASRPTLILYAEAQDIPVADLKLVQLDSINQNGQVRHWNFQAAPIEGQRLMKQLRVAGGLPTGKYAFVLFNGYLNEGNHKFWPFEVKDGVAEPEEQAQTTTIPVKANPNATPTPALSQTQPTPKPTPNTEPPPGAKLGYCNDTNVFVRSSPELTARPVTKITQGQKLWAIGKSTNTSTWNGITSDWTQVQLYQSTTRGWVFSPFVSY